MAKKATSKKTTKKAPAKKAAPKQQSSSDEKDLTSSCVVVLHSVRRWTGYKFDRKVSDEVAQSKNAANNAGRYNKHLIDRSREEYRELDRLLSAARMHHYENTLPFERRGGSILPIANYADYCKAQDRFVEQVRESKKRFVAAYEEIVTKERERLGDLFKEEDYPLPEEIGDKFEISYKVLPFPNPDHFLVKLGRAEDDKIRKDLERSIKQSIADAQRELFERLQRVVQHAADRLDDQPKSYQRVMRYAKAQQLKDDPSITIDKIEEIEGSEGKKVKVFYRTEAAKTFHNTLIDNIREVVEILPKLNITNDPELEKLRQRVDKVLCQYDPGELKPTSKSFDPKKRKQAKRDADAILKAMAGYTGA